MAEGLYIITDTSAIHALAKYAAQESLRGKGLMETARKVFAFLVSFALAKIPNGDPKKIRAQLMQVTTAYSRVRAASVGVTSNLRSRKVRRNRTADALRGTLAAKLVYLLNYAGARAVKGTGFYKLVRKFVSGRVRAARLHRAGLSPAIAGVQQGRVGRVTTKGGALPKFRHTPGSYAESLTADVASILAENWASAHGPGAEGIVGLAGFAFDAALPEVDRLLTGYLQKDIVQNARKAGFAVT